MLSVSKSSWNFDTIFLYIPTNVSLVYKACLLMQDVIGVSHIYIYIYTHTYTYTYIRTHTHIHVQMCMCLRVVQGYVPVFCTQSSVYEQTLTNIHPLTCCAKWAFCITHPWQNTWECVFVCFIFLYIKVCWHYDVPWFRNEVLIFDPQERKYLCVKRLWFYRATDL